MKKSSKVQGLKVQGLIRLTAEQKRFYETYYKGTVTIEITQPSGQKLKMMGLTNEAHALKETAAYRPQGSTHKVRATTIEDYYEYEVKRK